MEPPSADQSPGKSARTGGQEPPAERPPEVVVRRLTWGPAWPMIAMLLISGVTAGAWAVVEATGGMAVAAVVAGGCLAVFLLASGTLLAAGMARARTEFGPDGIRNRALRKEVFVPWGEIRDVAGLDMPPRVIQLVRTSGKNVTLAAVRDDGTAPDGLGFDDLVGLVRERASIDTDAGRAQDGPRRPAQPVALRTSRRPLLWAVPVMAGILAAVVAGLAGGAHLGAVIGPLFVLDVFIALMSIKFLGGRTEADASGIRNRLVRKTRNISWRDVTSLYVLPTLFGRSVVVSTADGKRYSLAAPREGLLARDRRFDETLEAMTALAAPKTVTVSRVSVRATRITVWVLVAVLAGVSVFLWRPWLETWWPGRAEADSLPRACPIVELTVAGWPPPAPERTEARHEDAGFSTSSECGYRSNPDAGAFASVSLEMDLERRTGSAGATENAREGYLVAREDRTRSVRSRTADGKDRTATMGDVPGLGDQAWRSVALDRREGDTEVALVMRRANVLVEIDYAAERPKDEVVAAVDALAREVLGRIDTG